MTVLVVVALAVFFPAGVSAPAWGQCQVTELAGLAASDASANDEFGISTSVSGNAAVIGAWKSDVGSSPYGSAYVYRFDGADWIEEVELTASDAAMGDEFGVSVAVSGNVAVIGSHLDDDVGGTDCGSAYVFEFDGTNWVQRAKLTASDAQGWDNFGYSAAIDGNWVVVGANLDDGVGGNSGSAYVFGMPTGGWTNMTETAKLTAADQEGNDEFGKSVAISGDVILVGAHYAADGSATQTGLAYVFQFDGLDWNQEAKLTASGAADFDRFGLSVSISGDRALVGAWGDDDGASATGSAYVFEKPPGGWADMTETAKLSAWDAATGDHFGWSVFLIGEVAAIGAPATLWDGVGPGSAYVFQFDGLVWNGQAKLTASDGLENSQFGYSLAVTEAGFGIIGASRHPTGGYMNAGAAYAFHGLADCNLLGSLDVCDIAEGTSQDTNGNGIPDECECLTLPGDVDGDDDVDGADIAAFVECFLQGPNVVPGCPCADVGSGEPDGVLDGADVIQFVALLLAG